MLFKLLLNFFIHFEFFLHLDYLFIFLTQILLKQLSLLLSLLSLFLSNTLCSFLNSSSDFLLWSLFFFNSNFFKSFNRTGFFFDLLRLDNRWLSRLYLFFADINWFLFFFSTVCFFCISEYIFNRNSCMIRSSWRCDLSVISLFDLLIH